ncbi:uroporphyrinogen-III synthase [Solimonas soli]|uniref:uroporphyrinogen-III synthase n=1 Tax=Solimonas soli TaxID=413479 RepID=UPI0004BB36FC|nr:uroporphyrinogen-III synthase [Solimonas soli]
METEASLRGLRVLVTRPAAQADALCQMLAARGADVLRLPLQAIAPARQPALLMRALAEARSAEAWIFTSVNAVEQARALDAGVWPRAIAVGAATAAALERLGVTVVAPAASYNSEGVLALPELQQCAGRRYALITGEDGRTLIADTLRARGAELTTLAVYRRVDLPYPPAQIAELLAATDVAIVTSGEALAQLARLLPAGDAGLLRRLQLVVPSQRVVEQARQIGVLAAPLMPEQVADASYVRCLEAWHRR